MAPGPVCWKPKLGSKEGCLVFFCEQYVFHTLCAERYLCVRDKVGNWTMHAKILQVQTNALSLFVYLIYLSPNSQTDNQITGFQPSKLFITRLTNRKPTYRFPNFRCLSPGPPPTKSPHRLTGGACSHWGPPGTPTATGGTAVCRPRTRPRCSGICWN